MVPVEGCSHFLRGIQHHLEQSHQTPALTLYLQEPRCPYLPNLLSSNTKKALNYCGS